MKGKIVWTTVPQVFSLNLKNHIKCAEQCQVDNQALGHRLGEFKTKCYC